MAQIFHRSTNTLARVSIYGSVFVLLVLSFVLYGLSKSPYYTEVNEPKDQPVPFSHRHHAGELGIDCRYCHTSVEDSSFAGLPPTKTCMTCHSQIWTNSAMLEPVRSSYATGKSLEWVRVNALPDFVYFNHSIHIHKGIGCTTCHGPVGDMPLTWKANTLQMSWCLECHRNPEKYVRPREKVFLPLYEPPANQEEMGEKLVAEYKIPEVKKGNLMLTNCTTCHR
ncbi:MAG TPA: cytochrome c3 family protein [Patescibacteria group bacterium]|nr:cytochrome c3 family protein [Patescibacteria group bacterium]